MADEVVPTTPAPAAPVAAPVAAPAPTPAPQATQQTIPAVVQEPRYLSDRLEQKARGILKDVGFKAPKGQSIEESVKQAKEKLDSNVARRKKAEDERDGLAAKALILETQLGSLKQIAQMQMQGLTDEQKKIVKDAAGDNPVEMLQQISTLQRIQTSQMTPAPAAAPVAAPPAAPVVAPPPAAPPAPVVVAPPASTAPPAAPPPPAPASPDDARANYEALRAVNPYLAREYLLNHAAEIYPDRSIDQVKQSRRF